MSVSISFLFLLLTGVAATCDVGNSEEGCWEDSAANFVQMKSRTNAAVKAPKNDKTKDGSGKADDKDEEIEEVDEVVKAFEAERSATAALLKEVIEQPNMRPLMPRPDKSDPAARYKMMSEQLDKIKEKLGGKIKPGMCIDFSGTYKPRTKGSKTLNLVQNKDGCKGKGTEGKKSFKYLSMRTNIITDDGRSGKVMGEEVGERTILFTNMMDGTESAYAEGSGGPVMDALMRPLVRPLGPKGPPMKPLGLKPLGPKGPPMKPLGRASPPLAPAAGSPKYEWFMADCTGAVIKTIQGDDPAAQTQCTARAACVGWSVNYETNVRQLRGKDCKEHAAGDWVYFKKMQKKPTGK
mmetsp:Transcript_13805/g.26328  ORF Transcript_13805/g.26328 Transcript_13805/m.26328 type:complete len:351 (+) Transcript_13805:47-1099(+)